MKIILTCIVGFLFTNICFAQNITLSGKIVDSNKTPLQYVNVFANPQKEASITYAVSSKKGTYTLRLQKGISYKITVSYLGFKPFHFEVTPNKATIKNIVLEENTELLDEVTLKYVPPIVVNKDTITYKTSAFTNGDERKLKDILKKLPGVEIDRLGNVKVKGKRINRFLVENKKFFTGDTKLGVNNIPADAVDKIQIIDNYSDVALLKKLEESEDIAMNIKLKEDKKNFWFGDIEAGAGVKKRYLLHPSLFFYNPKRSISLIGDFNNYGTKSFTIDDYLKYEGWQKNKIMSPTAYFSNVKSDFAQFLTNKKFIESNQIFGASNLQKTINDKTELAGYAIYSNSKEKTKTHNINQYLNSATPITENRSHKNEFISNFLIAKIGLERKFKNDSELKITSNIKSLNNTSNGILSIRTFNENYIKNKIKNFDFSIKNNFELYSDLSENHVLTTLGYFNFFKGDDTSNWQVNENIFQSSIPVITDSSYNINKHQNKLSKNISLLIKHYWTISDFFHIYTSLGYRKYLDNINSTSFQKFNNGNTNNFSNHFDNNIDSDFNDWYIGNHLKFRIGKISFKPGFFTHRYIRTVTQGNQPNKVIKNYWLPDLNIKYSIGNSETVRFFYKKSVRFPSLTNLTQNYTLINFNSIYKGDISLKNEISHQANIRYYKFNMFRKFSYNLGFTYSKKEQSIRNKMFFEGINYYSQPILIENSNESYNLSGSIGKGFRRINLSLSSSYSNNKYLQFISEELITNTSDNISFSTNFKTIFSDYPNINISYSKLYNNYKNLNGTSKFATDTIDLFLNYDWLDNYFVEIDYQYKNFLNKSLKNSNNNQILDFSFRYDNPDIHWKFSLLIKNVFDNQFIRKSNTSNIIIRDTKTFVMPRIVMFKISYKI